MHFNELPDVVVANIIQSTCGDYDCSTSSAYRLNVWTPKLVLLAVCRRWRELGLSGAHRQSFISSGHTVRRKRDDSRTDAYDSHSEGSGYTSSFEDLVEGPRETSHTIKSNLDIIRSKGCTSWPKELRVYITAPYNPMNNLRDIMEKMRNCGHLLSKVKRLHFFFDLGYDGGAQTDEPNSASEARLVGQDVALFLPSVQSIQLFGTNDAPVTLEFGKSVIKRYAHQLTEFICPLIALERVDSFSEKLQHVEINGHRGSLGYLPQICTENLVSLDLQYIQRSFRWSSFNGGEDSGILNFANLTWLRLKTELELTMANEETGDWGHSARKFNYRIVAPKLESVSLSLCPFTLSFMSSIHGLAVIENVNLDMHGAHLQFTNFNLDMARELFASYADESQGEVQLVNMYAYMNDIFNVSDLAEYTAARVGFYDHPLDIEQINWKYLSGIDVYCQVHLKDLRKLILRMPNLEYVYIDKLIMKENGQTLPEVLDEQSSIEPVRSKIRTFRFANWFGYTDEEVDGLMGYVDKLLPDCSPEQRTDC